MSNKVIWSTAACVAVGSIIVWACPRVASACSAPGPGIFVRTVDPPDGATGVPTNAEVLVRYKGTFDLDPQVRIRQPGMPVLDADVKQISGFTLGDDELFIVRPTAALAANTTYEVLDRVTVPCTDCTLGGFEVVATFTTGTGTDTSPPDFAGLASLDSNQGQNSGTCGDYTYLTFALSWKSASDDEPTAWLRYNVYNTRGLIAARVSSDQITGETICSGRADFDPLEADFEAGTGLYWVRAVDLAGNEDQNTHELATGSCGTPALPDAGAGGTVSADAGPVGAASPGGCAVTLARGGAGARAPAVLAAFALLAWAGRRRRVREAA